MKTINGKKVANWNGHRHPDDRYCGFGKYAGRKYKNIPTEYLIWFHQHAYHQMKDRKQWVGEELQRRGYSLDTYKLDNTNNPNN